MPVRPMRPCRQPGCPHLTSDRSGYCPGHLTQTRRELDAERPNSNERGYNYRWRQTSKLYLKEHPLCVYCFAKQPQIIRAATLVDHFIPHKRDYTLFWNKDNWRASCDECHNIKTAKEDGAFGNPTGRGD